MMPSILRIAVLLVLTLAVSGRAPLHKPPPCRKGSPHKAPVKHHSPSPSRSHTPPLALRPPPAALNPPPADVDPLPAGLRPPPVAVRPCSPADPSACTPAYQTLHRYFSNGTTVQQGWITSGATFQDGNMYQAAQITRMPFTNLIPTQLQLASNITAATAAMAQYGAIGTVDQFVNVFKTNRTGRAAVFRTDTDVFVWIPGTNTGTFECACGDWATNYEVASAHALQGNFTAARDISKIKILQGFHDMFTIALRDSLTALIDVKLQELQPGWAPSQPTDALIYFIGHSQGATMALLASTYFYASGYPLGGTYMFADPSPTGINDHSLEDYFHSNNLWNNTFRIINGADIIPTLPPDCYHVGRTTVMCPSSTLTVEDNPSWDYPSCSKLDYLVADSPVFHDLAFYQNSVLRSLTQQSTATFPPLIAAGSLYAKDLPLTNFCQSDTDCTQGCGTLTAAAACGAAFQCDDLTVLDSFTCASTLGSGSVCKSDSDCSSGHCQVAFCVDCTETADCAAGQYCSVSLDLGDLYTCQTCKADGTTCISSQGCCSGNCHFKFPFFQC